MNIRPEPPQYPLHTPDWKWYSFCSAHIEYNPDCGACNAGRWIDEASPYEQLQKFLWKRSPRLWREWANRPESESRALLEKTFPKLGKNVHKPEPPSFWETVREFFNG
jgi:hypothetical protein